MGEITVRVDVRFLSKLFVECGLCAAGDAVLLKRGLPEGSKLKAFGIEEERLVFVFEHQEFEGQVEMNPVFENVRFEWHKF